MTPSRVVAPGNVYKDESLFWRMCEGRGPLVVLLESTQFGVVDLDHGYPPTLGRRPPTDTVYLCTFGPTVYLRNWPYCLYAYLSILDTWQYCLFAELTELFMGHTGYLATLSISLPLCICFFLYVLISIIPPVDINTSSRICIYIFICRHLSINLSICLSL